MSIETTGTRRFTLPRPFAARSLPLFLTLVVLAPRKLGSGRRRAVVRSSNSSSREPFFARRKLFTLCGIFISPLSRGLSNSGVIRKRKESASDQICFGIVSSRRGALIDSQNSRIFIANICEIGTLNREFLLSSGGIRLSTICPHLSNQNFYLSISQKKIMTKLENWEHLKLVPPEFL